jgi:hypothetical protein
MEGRSTGKSDGDVEDIEDRVSELYVSDQADPESSLSLIVSNGSDGLNPDQCERGKPE